MNEKNKKRSWAETLHELNALENEALMLGAGPNDSIIRHITYLRKVPHDRRMRNIVHKELENLRAAKEYNSGIAERAPYPGCFEGEILLGHAIRPVGKPVEVRISRSNLLLNLLIAGLIGTGKTWLMKIILNYLTYTAIPVTVFDPNHSYDDVCRNRNPWIDISWDKLRLNPIRPPLGASYRHWIPGLVDQLTRNTLQHSKFLMAQRLDTLLSQANVPDIECGHPGVPSLFTLRNNLLNKKCKPGSKQEMYRESLLNVLDGQLRMTGSLYDCSLGMEASLLNYSSHLDIAGLSPTINMENLVTHLWRYRYASIGLTPGLPFQNPLLSLMIFEEAHTLLESHQDKDIATYQEMLLRGRSYGLGQAFITQNLSSIDPIVFGGISNYFIFALSSANDKRYAQQILDLSHKEVELLGTLQQGQCFVKFVGHPKWPHPFIMEVLS